MSYITKVLQPGETVRFSGRLHWRIYIAPVLLLLIGVALVGAAAQLAHAPTQQTNFASFAAFAAGAIFLLYGAFAWCDRFLQRASTEIVVTDLRVIYKTGLFSRHTIEMNISKIESVDVVQGVVGRILDYGAIDIRGTGAGFEPLRNIGAPLGLRNAILVG
jgi:uncharacterized membrane protein YdbT with pleckstrin-like domain